MFDKQEEVIILKFDVFVRIEHGYTEATTLERFAFMYENYERLDRVIECNKSIFIIMLQSSMMRANWEGYVEKYNWEHKDESIARIEKYIDNGEAIDFEIELGFNPDESLIKTYKNILLMKYDFHIFQNALECMSGPEKELMVKYIKKEISLSDIADEKCITYDTAKARIRDMKKLLKDHTMRFLIDYDQIA